MHVTSHSQSRNRTRLIIGMVMWLVVVFLGPLVPIEITRRTGANSALTWLAGLSWFVLLGMASTLIEKSRPHAGPKPEGCLRLGFMTTFVLGVLTGGSMLSGGCAMADLEFRGYKSTPPLQPKERYSGNEPPADPHATNAHMDDK